MSTVLLDAIATGGQAGTSTRIENYLGFPAGLSGDELTVRAVLQAQKFGARIVVPCEAVSLGCEADYYIVNTNTGDRMPLTVAISTDNDKSYPHRRNILNIPGDTAAYPVAIQTRDGKIHVVYTSNERQDVNHAVFDESAILGHPK